jgi:MerR family transcriptional regulator, copper efflux regulator
MANLMLIGEVAAAAAMTTDAVRYYEREGLIPKATRTHAGYRLYPPAVVHRLMVVRSAQQFGFSLKQISTFFAARDRGRRPCEDVRLAAQRLLDAVDGQIDTLRKRRSEMQQVLKEWDRVLTGTPPNQPARLLETLRAPGERSPSTRSRALRRG